MSKSKSRKGLQEGRQEGLQEGLAKGDQKAATALPQLGHSIAEIDSALQLDESEVRKMLG